MPRNTTAHFQLTLKTSTIRTRLRLVKKPIFLTKYNIVVHFLLYLNSLKFYVGFLSFLWLITCCHFSITPRWHESLTGLLQQVQNMSMLQCTQQLCIYNETFSHFENVVSLWICLKPTLYSEENKSWLLLLLLLLLLYATPLFKFWKRGKLVSLLKIYVLLLAYAIKTHSWSARQ